jgi:hypothetical protein
MYNLYKDFTSLYFLLASLFGSLIGAAVVAFCSDTVDPNIIVVFTDNVYYVSLFPVNISWVLPEPISPNDFEQLWQLWQLVDKIGQAIDDFLSFPGGGGPLTL